MNRWTAEGLTSSWLRYSVHSAKERPAQQLTQNLCADCVLCPIVCSQFTSVLSSLSPRPCLSHIQMPTHTRATCEVTGVWCPELCDQSSERLYALCNQQDYSCIRGSTPECLNIISLHMKQSAHTACTHSLINTCKSIKGPLCHFKVLLTDRPMECECVCTFEIKQS